MFPDSFYLLQGIAYEIYHVHLHQPLVAQDDPRDEAGDDADEQDDGKAKKIRSGQDKGKYRKLE